MLDTVDISGRPCEKCDVCNVTCISGSDIKDRVQHVTKLNDVPLKFNKA